MEAVSEAVGAPREGAGEGDDDGAPASLLSATGGAFGFSLGDAGADAGEGAQGRRGGRSDFA